MAWIKTYNENEATGLLARVYDTAIKRAGRVFNILRIQGQNPHALQGSMGLYAVLMKGESPLSRAQREMLAVVVSQVNSCHY